jgi:hypothetical protein
MTSHKPKNRNASVRFGFSVVADRIPSVSVGGSRKAVFGYFGSYRPNTNVSAVADRTHTFGMGNSVRFLPHLANETKGGLSAAPHSALRSVARSARKRVSP